MRVTTIIMNGYSGAHSRRRGFVWIDVLANKRHHIALDNTRRHEYGELRMVWPEASVVKVLRRPGQPPDPPWLRCIQRTKLGKPFGTRRNPLVTHEWVMRHERFKIEPGIERGTGPSGIRMETASSRIRLRSFTASRRRSPRRLRAAEYSDQSAKRVHTSSVDRADSKSGCIPIRTLDSTSQCLLS